MNSISKKGRIIAALLGLGLVLFVVVKNHDSNAGVTVLAPYRVDLSVDGEVQKRELTDKIREIFKGKSDKEIHAGLMAEPGSLHHYALRMKKGETHRLTAKTPDGKAGELALELSWNALPQSIRIVEGDDELVFELK
jgi:hypothetical protein